MKAMVLNRPGAPLEWTELADRQPGNARSDRIDPANDLVAGDDR